MADRAGRSSDGKWQLLPVIAVFPIAFMIVLLMNSAPAMPHASTQDWTGVEQVVGAQGKEFPDGTFMISLPRDDTQVKVDGVTLDPEMAMHAWIAFAPMGREAMMMGDLTLTTQELWIVQDRLQQEGLSITAIHNTLNNETPQVFDVHVSGRGDPAKLAGAVMNATKAAGVAFGERAGAADTRLFQGKEDLDRTMGSPGQVEGRVLHYSIPRAESVTDDGMVLSPYMDVATQLKFQPLSDNTAAITGDFVLRANEVGPVIRTLNENDIHVTALHMHMLTEEPRLFNLHYWAVGDQVTLARGLREALDQTNSSPGTTQAIRQVTHGSGSH